MLRIRRPSDGGSTPARERGSAAPLLGLQRMAGNRAVARLLQRQPADVKTQLGEIAALEQADLKAAGITASINETRAARVGEKGLQPGLNIVETLGGRGETGFVDGDATHVYRGDFLPVTLDGPLPQVAVMLSSHVFDGDKAAARTTLRHELTHAKHAQMLIAWLAKWRDAVKSAGGKRPSFAAWVGKQKMSDVEAALLKGDRGNHKWNTEVLAHVEGFIVAFTLDSTPPTASLVVKSRMPPAIEELRGLGDNGWASADEVVRTAALDRVKDFYSKLAPNAQASLREWLFYLLDRSTPKAPPSTSKDVEAQAARTVHGAFHPYVDMLEKILGVIRTVGFGVHAPPAPAAQTAVTDIHPPPVPKDRKAPKPTQSVTLGTGGKVTASAGVAYHLGHEPREHGMSLRYEGTDASKARWLQFIWWEVVPDVGPRVSGKMVHQTQEYQLTTNPAQPSYNTDTATYLGGVESAFYERENSANRTANSIEIFDQPGPPEFAVRDAFAREPKPGDVKVTAHLTDYLVIGMDVVFRSEVDFDWDFTAADAKPDATPHLKSAAPAKALDPGPRARLAQQFPSLDYLR